jgi:hypothetical protein
MAPAYAQRRSGRDVSDQALQDKFIELSRPALGEAPAAALLKRLSTGAVLPMAECFGRAD